jgi:hypothetical protein
MPLLKKAERVTVLSVKAGTKSGPPTGQAVNHLQRTALPRCC